MQLSDMKRSKAEKKAEAARWKSGPVDEDYPHSLHIEFDQDGLKKLGVDDMPKPGDEYQGKFHGRVTHSSEEADEDGEPRRRVRMVMHHVGMEPKDEEAKPDKAADDIRKAASKK